MPFCTSQIVGFCRANTVAFCSAAEVCLLLCSDHIGIGHVQLVWCSALVGRMCTASTKTEM